MLLATVYVLGPIAGMGSFIVEQTTNAQLFSGGSIPAGPVTGAGGFVPEYPVKPVAMIGSNWGI